ncbi:MAG: hypothetical protein HYT71_02365 [Candidatus Aenigmarchaeota archaeon]|nr:hypothetical protein [Candidatus Aenigmarchaeota archaeon]
MKYSYRKNQQKSNPIYLIGAALALIAYVLLTGDTQTPATTTTTTLETTTTSITTTTTTPTTTIEISTTTTTSTTTTITGNQPPQIISASQKPNPVKVGKTATFNIAVADAESEFVTVSVCKNANCTGRYCSVQGNTKPNGTAFSCTYDLPITTKGSFDYWVKADEAGRSSGIIGPFTLNVTSL